MVIMLIKVCKTYQDCGYSKSFPYIDPSGAEVAFGTVTPGFRVPFVTSDGISYMITIALNTSNNPSHKMWIDLNHSKGPNQLGKDLFSFIRVPGKGVLLIGYDLSESEINDNCSKTGNGDYCAAKIIKDGWEIKDDYPW
jgi:hypothetical protein